jgi:tetratricopeptide (TPR) repeat protein
VDTLLYIDEYFTGEPSEYLKKEFEKKILEDPAFAEDVSIYLSAKQIAGEQSVKQSKVRFREIYAAYKKTNAAAKPVGIIRKLLPYIAAAAVLTVLIIGWAVFSGSGSPEQMADKYIKENFQTLGVTMGSKEDSLQIGYRLYNEGKLNEALAQFESIMLRDTSSSQAIKYAGIASLRLKKYDKAISFFSQLGDNTQLYTNPGKFYQALTLINRNQPGDKQQAKDLLQQVVKNDLEEKEEAKKLLDKW